MDKILVFIDWYLPGTNAGGPVRSVANLTDHLGGEFSFSIITRNSDYCATEPYPDIVPDTWTTLNAHCRVCYLSPENTTCSTLRRLIRETPFDSAWINGIYSWKFSILPLLLLKRTGKRIVVSPRGMLNPQAFTSGKAKKKLFIALACWSELYKEVVFHATNDLEKQHILHQLGDTTTILVAPNLHRKVTPETGRPGDEVTGRLSDEEMGRPGDEVTGRPGDEVMGRQSDEEMGRSGDEEMGKLGDKSQIPNIQYPPPNIGAKRRSRPDGTDDRKSEQSGDPDFSSGPITAPIAIGDRLPITDYRLPSSKTPRSLRLVSIARISPEKGTLHALRFLREITTGRIHFDLYGPVYNEAYWKKCREVIDSLPSNVNVIWHGPAGGEQIREALAGAHFLLMPTEGENFGHSILEALAEGCPVIISDCTPWRGLEAKKAGFDLPLEDPSGFVKTLEWALDLDDPTWKEWCVGAETLASEYAENEAHLEACRKLFSVKRKV